MRSNRAKPALPYYARIFQGGALVENVQEKNAANIQVRWLIRRDLAEALDIENAVFEFPWTEDNFIRCLRQRNCIGMVADDRTRDKVAGFMLYELHKTRLHLLNFAVHPDYQRHGVGKAMIDKIKAKLSGQRRSRILLEVRESNLAAQLFFKAQGFKAISILRNFYEDTTEDAYLMQYRYQSAEPVLPVNRISRLLDD